MYYGYLFGIGPTKKLFVVSRVRDELDLILPFPYSCIYDLVAQHLVKLSLFLQSFF